MEIDLPRSLARTCAGLLLALATATSALAAPALWAVRDQDSTIYLFGTMHVLSRDAAWRTPAFDRALAESSVVWFETDVSAGQKVVAPLLLKYGFDFTTPLKDKLSPRTMEALRKALADFPGGQAVVEHLQPWTAATLVQMAPAMTSGLRSADGADAVIGRGLSDRQTVRYFETPEGQIRILADLPPAAQIQLLEDSLAGETFDDGLEMSQDAWLNGDVQIYGSAVAAGMRDRRPALYDVLLRRRNQAWVAVLAREMRGRGVEMVNVGALHLVGEDGLVAQLRKRGYVVERIQ